MSAALIPLLPYGKHSVLVFLIDPFAICAFVVYSGYCLVGSPFR